MLLDQNTSLNGTCYNSPDRTACTITTERTSGVLSCVLGRAICALTRTQHTLAHSNGKTELYALGLLVVKGLFLRSLVLRSNFSKSCNLFVLLCLLRVRVWPHDSEPLHRRNLFDFLSCFYMNLFCLLWSLFRKRLLINYPANSLTKHVFHVTMLRLSSAG